MSEIAICLRCGRNLIKMEDGSWECDSCCGNPDCEVCA